VSERTVSVTSGIAPLFPAMTRNLLDEALERLLDGPFDADEPLSGRWVTLSISLDGSTVTAALSDRPEKPEPPPAYFGD
jgi:hypothetical protein